MKENKSQMSGSTTNKKRLDYSRAAERRRLEDLVKNYEKQIEVEQEKIKEIDVEISNTESELNEQRKSLGASENACKVSTENMKRKANVLDKRVNQMFAKLNKAVADNREIRKRIDDLRQERVVYDGIYKKLEIELHEAKHEMSHIIEDGRQAHRSREKTINDLETLKKRVEESQKALESESKAYDELKLKSKPITETYVHQEATKIVSTNNQSKQTNNYNRKNRVDIADFQKVLSSKQEKAINHSVSFQQDENSNTLKGDQRESLTVVDSFASSNTYKCTPSSDVKEKEKVKYDDILEQIKKGTGEEDVDVIIETLKNAEEKNFSLYNYIAHELNGEVERIEAQISDVKLDIDKAKQARAKTNRKRNMKIEGENNEFDIKLSEYQSKHDNLLDSFKELKDAVEDIWNVVKGSG